MLFSGLSSVSLKQPLGNDGQSILQKLSALDRALRRVREKIQTCQNDIRTGSLNPQRKSRTGGLCRQY